MDPYRDPPFIPTYRSKFGGLWTDLTSAEALLQGKLDLDVISSGEAQHLREFIVEGFTVFRSAIPAEHLRRLNEDIEKIWACELPDAWISCVENDRSWVRKIKPGDREYAGMQTKLLDVYEYTESAREVIFNEAIVRFLKLIFERPVLAHQSLAFYRGSKQPIHRDTAYVRISSPMEMAAAWIALEDIQQDSGELEYYPKSHLYPDFLFEGKYKWFPPGNEELGNFYTDLNVRAKNAGVEAVKFRAKAGDVFIWSADLAHGGSDYQNDELTRKSLVAHYSPLNVDPMYYTYNGRTEKHQFKPGCYYTAAPKAVWRSGPAD